MQLSNPWIDSTASVSGGKGTTYDRRSRKQVKKRVTPEEDYDRLAERVWQRGGGKIKNKADYMSVYAGYMRDSGQKDNVDLREGVFGRIQKRHDVSSSIVTKKERVEIFNKAGMRPSDKEFTFLGVSKGKPVYARSTRVRRVLKTGEVRNPVVFRDKKGRFVSVKR